LAKSARAVLEIIKKMNTTEGLPLNQILIGDCLEEMGKLPAGSVDLVFADPPYNLQLHQELWRPNQTRVEAVNESWDQFADFEEYDRFCENWLAECRRLLKPSGTIWVIGTYHNIFRIGRIMQDLDYWILNDVVWVKTNPMPNFRGVRFTNAHETLIWAQKERGAPYTFNHHAMKHLNQDLQMRSDWNLPVCGGKERLRVNGKRAHPTQKPEALLYRVISASTNPRDLILDPFFGSGTSGVVAKRLHRHWIGIEKEVEYVRIARTRIASTPQEDYQAQVFETPSPRKKPRVPFAALVEHGYLNPGQRLYFTGEGDITAVVTADGKVEWDGTRGSIHQVAREIRQAPCNGWEQWRYVDEVSGASRLIDDLREKYRAEHKSGKTNTKVKNESK
jgi:DNA modification methylase